MQISNLDIYIFSLKMHVFSLKMHVFSLKTDCFARIGSFQSLMNITLLEN